MLGRADEHAVSDDRRLRADGGRTGEAERPFKFELREVGLLQTSGLGALVACVIEVDAPAGPVRFLPGVVAHVGIVRALHQGFGQVSGVGISPVELRDVAGQLDPLVGGQREGKK